MAGWGAHTSKYPVPYLTAAAAIGMQKSDVDQFISRLDKVSFPAPRVSSQTCLFWLLDTFYGVLSSCLQVINKLKGRSAPQTPTSVEELAMSGRRSKRSMNGEVSSSSERGDRDRERDRDRDRDRERDRRSRGGGSSLDGETGSSRSREEVRAPAGRSRGTSGAAAASPSLNGEVSFL